MDKFYIKEGNVWLGPLSEIEFEFRKSELDSFEYWKPEFCSNHILHPGLCSHTKTWIRSQQKNKQDKVFESTQQEKEKLVRKGNNEYSAKPHKSEEESVEKTMQLSESKPETKQQFEQEEDRSHEVSTLFKVIVIILGFVMVIIAAFYVNSKFKELSNQDLMIRESFRYIEYNTRDMHDETKKIKDGIDSLNLKIEKQYKSLNKELSDINLKLQNIEIQ